MNLVKIIVLALGLNLLLIHAFSMTVNSDYTESLKDTQIEILPFQKSLTIEIFPDVTKKLKINRKQLAKYITKDNEHKIMKSFILQYQSVLRSAEIYVTIFQNRTKNDQQKPTVFDFNKDSNTQQSTIFSLSFLSKFHFQEILTIQLDIRSKTFAVLELTLLNNEISDHIDLHKSSESTDDFGKIPVWMPSSYDPQAQKSKQITKYFYFTASQNPTKLRINRIKGHPKIFLYNCDETKIDFCRQQIDKQHIEGSLMFQKQLQVTLIKQYKCKNCSIILAIKNMGAETKMEITEHKDHDSVVLSKDNPIYSSLKGKQSLDVSSYFILPEKIDANSFILDFSITDGDSNSLNVEFFSIVSLSSSEKSLQTPQLSTFFVTEKQPNSLKIKLTKNSDLSKYSAKKDLNNQTWFKISVKLSVQKNTDFIIVDRNIPSGEENFISLNEGVIFHSYVAGFIETSAEHVQTFKVKVSSISVLTISTLCSEINKMVIQFGSQQNNTKNQGTTKISPKVFVENITHFNKKCSQLIHLNPLQLFVNEEKVHETKTTQQSGWVYFRITGVRTQVDLLYSSSDIITLQKSFPYHSQLQYNQALYFHVPKLENQVRIKIQKCSDCQITVSFSQQQLVDLNIKRSQEIISKQISSISNVFSYKMKEQNGLFVKVKTNNFAHFAIVVQDIKEQQEGQLPTVDNNRVTFSLQQNTTLTLEFPTPTFFYTNNLNSPTYFSLIEGSINVQVARQTYCPEFIFSEKQRTRDISITNIVPQLVQDELGNEKYIFSMELKRHDFFGLRAQKGDEIFSYQVVSIESLKTFSMYKWPIFNVALFITFAAFMSFVCFMGLKKNRIKKMGGQVVMQSSEDNQQTSMIRLN